MHCDEPLSNRFFQFQRAPPQQGDDTGAAKMDLVRYVEFQNSFSLIKKTHQWALQAGAYARPLLSST